MDWSSRQWIFASTVAAATLGTLFYLRKSAQESAKALAALEAAPKRRAPKRQPREPQKHELGQVALPKSEYYPKPPADEADPNLFLSAEELESLSQHAHALQYKLSDDQLRALDEDGFLVIKKLIPGEICDRMLKEIDERATKLFKTNSQDLDTDSSRSVFLDIWHNQAYYEIRQNLDLYSIFCQLMKRHDLTAAIDRVAFLPQAQRQSVPDYSQVALMCDTSFWHASPTRFQCMIAATDQDSEVMQVLPGAHKIEEIQSYRTKYMNGEFGESANLMGVDWRAQHHYRDIQLQDQCSERLGISKGDIIIWNTRMPYALLPDSSGRSGRAALMCFASFRPADGSQEDVDFRRNIARSLMTVTAPTWFGNGLPIPRSSSSNLEAEASYEPARVNGIGLKLFGINGWGAK